MHARVPVVAATCQRRLPCARHPTGRTLTPQTPTGGSCPCPPLTRVGASLVSWQGGPPVPAPAKVQGEGCWWLRGEKSPVCPWCGCNSINEAWPSFSAANKANGPAQAWCCLVVVGGGSGGGRGPGGHLLIKWGWGTMELVVMSPPWCSRWGGAVSWHHLPASPSPAPGCQAGLWGTGVNCGGPPEIPAPCPPP